MAYARSGDMRVRRAHLQRSRRADYCNQWLHFWKDASPLDDCLRIGKQPLSTDKISILPDFSNR